MYIIIEKKTNDLFNFILISKRTSSKVIASNAFDLKFTIKRSFNTLNDDIMTSSFTLITKFIIRFIINKVFESVFITKSFEIIKLYRNLTSNPFVLLIKVAFIEFYKFRNFKKIIMNFYHKMH